MKKDKDENKGPRAQHVITSLQGITIAEQGLEEVASEVTNKPIEGCQILYAFENPRHIRFLDQDEEEKSGAVLYEVISANQFASDARSSIGALTTGVTIDIWGYPAKGDDEKDAIIIEPEANDPVQIPIAIPVDVNDKGESIDAIKLMSFRLYWGKSNKQLPRGEDGLVLIAPEGHNGIPLEEYKTTGSDGKERTNYAPAWKVIGRGWENLMIQPIKSNSRHPNAIITEIMKHIKTTRNAPSEIEKNSDNQAALNTPIAEVAAALPADPLADAE